MARADLTRKEDPTIGCGITACQLAAFRSALRSFFGRRVREPEEVEDLVQETLTRLFASARDMELREPQAYLFRIAANLLADRYRRGRSPLARACPYEETEAIGVAADQEEPLAARDLQVRLETALAELPARCAQILVMRRFRDMDTCEIAHALGISQRMVQKYLVQATAHLYLRLSPFREGGR